MNKPNTSFHSRPHQPPSSVTGHTAGIRPSCLTLTPTQKERPSSSSKIHLLSGGRCRKVLTAKGTWAFLFPAPCHRAVMPPPHRPWWESTHRLKGSAKTTRGRALVGQLPSIPKTTRGGAKGGQLPSAPKATPGRALVRWLPSAPKTTKEELWGDTAAFSAKAHTRKSLRGKAAFGAFPDNPAQRAEGPEPLHLQGKLVAAVF